MFVSPLTPPSSDPGSPGSSLAAAAAAAQANQQSQQHQQQQHPRRTTPPPPYQQQLAQQQQQGHALSSICPNIISLHGSSSGSGLLLSPGRSITTLGNVNSSSCGNNNNANGNSANSSILHNSSANNNHATAATATTRGGNIIGNIATPAHLANIIVPTVRSVRYNRRNNPELEKRRIHHCDYMGKLKAMVPEWQFKISLS